MALKKYQDKQMKSEDVRNKEGSPVEFHFAGGLEYRPLTVKARTREEAQKIWEKQRIKVGENKSANKNE